MVIISFRIRFRWFCGALRFGFTLRAFPAPHPPRTPPPKARRRGGGPPLTKGGPRAKWGAPEKRKGRQP